ncbi:MAG: 50S ribosomal protein L5 [Candidatus Terrybacteria bacterium RIFCSPLOWO2_01_FULL_44_24]|uniref:Large ribosomal subunit protein uL5 n=1 Tax=Candidatus Terrybacteria bacterium RIFCSPHIGHO2_01_FULL_43_35 TaxID=1802361 RepID=A0A1G2PCY8_9BACT|nr:MAG: 50S ribosomal protein L5 [Candidatus Terrybacteria bacterium RIFCSPHIGHO2_01_FULL_43_35]OHA49422.1 MAG: 50S ribosomal protein L5 [Candidatus Terrybacteria bacterium RIFCSPHIGHO2_02_FULL_43_14]OHA51649.1 MAG: 50S ribosomal protein L5 [Candidatus Terrybacteria bacterium RIFCSPLOWO2_01_FULL_44_24]
MVLLKEKYAKKVVPELMARFGIKNIMAVPRITKVTVNTGIARLLSQKTDQDKIMNAISEDLARITGQKPEIRYARKDIANFKLRQGAPVGLRVTLRGTRMHDFIARLVNIDLPRTRDFKGLSISSVDEGGNLNIGVKEQIVFPEVSPDSIRLLFGFSITIGTTAKNKEQALALFHLLGFPFENQQ